MSIVVNLGRYAGAITRAVRTPTCARADDGRRALHPPRVFVGGVFRHAHCPAGGVFGPWIVEPNRIVNEGLNYLLNAGLGGVTPTTAFSLAPFSGNVTPASSWTGANFVVQATEFTAYTATTRLPWKTVLSSAQSIGNTAAIAEATLTFNEGGPYNLYGVGLLEASAKSATTGRLIAATRFASPRTNMSGGDKLAIEYVMTAKDEADG